MQLFLSANGFNATAQPDIWENSMKLNKIHHVAIIASNFDVSKDFYCRILGLNLLEEHYRPANNCGKQT